LNNEQLSEVLERWAFQLGWNSGDSYRRTVARRAAWFRAVARHCRAIGQG
jgi:hypothetical protein